MGAHARSGSNVRSRASALSSRKREGHLIVCMRDIELTWSWTLTSTLTSTPTLTRLTAT